MSSPGAAALKLLGEEAVDLVLTDFIVPNVYGFKLVDAIRGKCPAAHVIVTSGYLEEATAKLILDTEVDIIAKPIDLNELAAKISKALEKYQ